MRPSSGADSFVIATHFPAGISRITCTNLCKIKQVQITWLSTLTKSSDTT